MDADVRAEERAARFDPAALVRLARMRRRYVHPLRERRRGLSAGVREWMQWRWHRMMAGSGMLIRKCFGFAADEPCASTDVTRRVWSVASGGESSNRYDGAKPNHGR